MKTNNYTFPVVLTPESEYSHYTITIPDLGVSIDNYLLTDRQSLLNIATQMIVTEIERCELNGLDIPKASPISKIKVEHGSRVITINAAPNYDNTDPPKYKESSNYSNVVLGITALIGGAFYTYGYILAMPKIIPADNTILLLSLVWFPILAWLAALNNLTNVGEIKKAKDAALGSYLCTTAIVAIISAHGLFTLLANVGVPIFLCWLLAAIFTVYLVFAFPIFSGFNFT